MRRVIIEELGRVAGERVVWILVLIYLIFKHITVPKLLN